MNPISDSLDELHQQAALAYAERGRRVLRWSRAASGRCGACAGGRQQARGDRGVVEREPRADVGVACIGDLVVLDVDGREGELILVDPGRRSSSPAMVTTAAPRAAVIGGRRPEGLTEGWRYGGLELKATGYVVRPRRCTPQAPWTSTPTWTCARSCPIFPSGW